MRRHGLINGTTATQMPLPMTTRRAAAVVVPSISRRWEKALKRPKQWHQRESRRSRKEPLQVLNGSKTSIIRNPARNTSRHFWVSSLCIIINLMSFFRFHTPF
ncbi:hypothetical protein CFOL_v3_30996 [Cephalotus follicularis]|uniref:Uncharacterized protein n=1 Tax=Cephalotus follicularis TaxID=3775 RepID=A0A1Q3D518_CEPFO|nr:hypothetical protein CFOL_v3_30996 [Cephalotus follicularis]